MNKVIFSGILLLGIFTIGCGDKPAPKGHDHGVVDSGGVLTKIIKHEGYEFVFDLSPREQHMQMMQMMKLKMKHQKDTDQFISLTVIDMKTNKVVKDAGVVYSLTFPAGSSKPLKTQPAIGGGMAHFIAEFKKQGAGAYKVNAEVQIADKKHTHVATFTLK